MNTKMVNKDIDSESVRPPEAAQIPTRVLVLFALILTPTGLILFFNCSRNAWVDAHKLQAQGIVIETRVFDNVKPPARARGHWLKERLVEFETEGGQRRTWFRAGWFPDKEEAGAARDLGQVVPVWYSPGKADNAVVNPPLVLQNLFWSCWSAVIGAAGLISIYVLIQMVMKRRLEWMTSLVGKVD